MIRPDFIAAASARTFAAASAVAAGLLVFWFCFNYSVEWMNCFAKPLYAQRDEKNINFFPQKYLTELFFCVRFFSKKN